MRVPWRLWSPCGREEDGESPTEPRPAPLAQGAQERPYPDDSSEADTVPILPDAPTIGKVAQSWQRRLTASEWPRPGYVADGGAAGGIHVLAASVVGKSHLNKGAQRQDAYHLAPAGDGVVAALADGVSAYPMSEVGAEVASASAVSRVAALASEQVSDGFDRKADPAGWLSTALEHANDAVRNLAQAMEVEPRTLSTTLLIAYVARDQRGGLRVTTAAVGDSSALAVTGTQPPTVISGPEPTDHHAPLSSCVPDMLGDVHIDRCTLDPDTTLVLASDGLADDLHRSPAVRRWMLERLATAQTPLEFAHCLSYRRQGTADDLTAIAVRAKRS